MIWRFNGQLPALTGRQIVFQKIQPLPHQAIFGMVRRPLADRRHRRQQFRPSIPRIGSVCFERGRSFGQQVGDGIQFSRWQPRRRFL